MVFWGPEPWNIGCWDPLGKRPCLALKGISSKHRRSGPWALFLRVQSTQTWSIHGFCIWSRKYGLGYIRYVWVRGPFGLLSIMSSFWDGLQPGPTSICPPSPRQKTKKQPAAVPQQGMQLRGFVKHGSWLGFLSFVADQLIQLVTVQKPLGLWVYIARTPRPKKQRNCCAQKQGVRAVEAPRKLRYHL